MVKEPGEPRPSANIGDILERESKQMEERFKNYSEESLQQFREETGQLYKDVIKYCDERGTDEGLENTKAILNIWGATAREELERRKEK